ncbi:MAG: asparagine synthase (glutamine-hydrolyzing) [Bacteroidetes bacterium]|nr:MAG: asparagine synthase (glutamine-hydrolyzing) [Bacteroidota bacterium]
MCGIAGIVNISGSVENMPVHIKAMSDTIRHRGPDGEGFLFFNGVEVIPAYGNDTPEGVVASSLKYSPKIPIQNISQENIQFALGHRRLSIIDVSAAGHQPMCDHEKRIWIVYNGEIYNHIELREDLSQKGITFRTNTDTEVILQSYLHWGEECVNHFNGMWAFVIFDSIKNILFGSRDRVGVKPFYYFNNGNCFAFASEQKALLKLPFVNPCINIKAASEFLAGDIQYIERGEENMFSTIFELMPAQNFTIDLRTKSFQRQNYYSLTTHTSFSSFNDAAFKKYRDETEKLLIDSVKLRLRSDVPVGSCLSGGIDSSAIVSIMAKLAGGGYSVNLGGKLKVFTLSFDDPSIDESKWARYVVDQTQAEWHRVSPSAEDLLRDMQDLNYAQDIPVCSTGTYGQFQLMRKAKEAGIKVILDGQGGDELFGGYMSHSIVYWKELFRCRKFGMFLSEASADGNLFFNLRQMVRDFSRREFSLLFPKSFQQSFYKSYFKKNYFLNNAIVNEYVCSGGLISELEVSRSSSLNEALLKDFTNTRLKMYLKYEDRSSMWHSIEARTPFADDHRMVEYVFNVPGSYKIHKGINKYLLREAARHYLPKEIKERKDKLGFVTPIDQWMKQMQSQCLDYFSDSLSDFIDVKKIKKDPAKFFDISSHADGVRAFRIVSFAVWKKIFNL